MSRRLTALVLLAAAALTAPAAYAQAHARMTGHCDEQTAIAPVVHEGMHHPAPAPAQQDHGTLASQDGNDCAHCASTPCLATSHCAGGFAGLTIHAPATDGPALAPSVEPSAARRPGCEAHAPPTPPPDTSPIAS